MEIDPRSLVAHIKAEIMAFLSSSDSAGVPKNTEARTISGAPALILKSSATTRAVAIQDNTGTRLRISDTAAGGNDAVNINGDGVLFPEASTLAAAPSYANGGLYFNTTDDKLMVGGATEWETVISSQPAAGKKKVYNIYWDQAAGLPVFEVEA